MTTEYFISSASFPSPSRPEVTRSPWRTWRRFWLTSATSWLWRNLNALQPQGIMASLWYQINNVHRILITVFCWKSYCVSSVTINAQGEQENYFTRPECSLSNDQISRKDWGNKLWQNIQSETRIFTLQRFLSECGFRTGNHYEL